MREWAPLGLLDSGEHDEANVVRSRKACETPVEGSP